ncbi:MAG: hypothetical protein NTU44_04475 [Bacteroidetes bacterium]|nr:hypothetical protein [Bacteroidota bacterium]
MKTETGLACNTTYTRYVWQFNACGHSASSVMTGTTTLYPDAPEEGTHIGSATQILWDWNTVPGAIGYKWNSVVNYATAIDMGPMTTYTETGLTVGTTYTRYVWAYNACGHSDTLAMTALASSCGQPLTIIYSPPVAPFSSTTTSGTVAKIPGEPDKCWITSNLGAIAGENSYGYQGLFWQFNNKKGYIYNGVYVFPSGWIWSANGN